MAQAEAGTAAAAPSGSLARLVEAEERLDAMLEARAREAESIVAEAHAAVARRLAEVEAELGAMEQATTAELDAATAERVAVVERQAAARCEVLRRALEVQLGALVAGVVAAVLADIREEHAP